MANPHHGETAQQNRSGGHGPSRKRGEATRGSLRMHTAAWPTPPGSTNPGWKPKHGRSVKQHPTSRGI